MLTSNVEEGRIVLREALVGPIKFTPDEDAGVYKSKVSRRWVTCRGDCCRFPLWRPQGDTIRWCQRLGGVLNYYERAA
jgi:hypothetical protein